MPQTQSYIVGSGDDRNIPQETEEVRPRAKSGDSQGLVSLRAGTKTVETNWNTPNRAYDDREKNGTENNVQSEEKVRAVETRSKGKQGEGQLQDSTGGQAGRNSEGSAILPVRVILSNYTDNDLALRQKEDPDIEFIYESMLRGRKRPTSSDTVTKSPTARHYWVIWDSLNMCDGLIFKECLQKNGQSKYYQLLVPRSLKKEVLNEVYSGKMGGHFGCCKTYEKVKLKYYWYEMKDNVINWVLSCDVCASNKTPFKKPKSPLGSLGVGATLATLSIDMVGPFPVTSRNNRYILVVTDHFTKWVEIFAVPDQSATTTTNVILNEVIARYGSPLSIHNDLGTNYESHISRALQTDGGEKDSNLGEKS